MDYFRSNINQNSKDEITYSVSNLPKGLVIQTAFLGDVILTIPTLKILHQNSELTIIVRQGLGDLLREVLPGIRVYEIQKGNRKSYQTLINKLKLEQFDFILSPHRSLRSAFLVYSLSSSLKIGYYDIWSFWAYHIRVRRDRKFPEFLRILQLLIPLINLLKLPYNFLDYFKRDILYHVPDRQGRLPSIGFFNEEEYFMIPWHQRDQKVAIFFGSQWETKKWPLAYYFEVYQWLVSRGYEVYWLGTSKEEEEFNQFLRDHSFSIPTKYHLLGKLSLVESFRFLKNCQLVISNDSGGGHLGALAMCCVVTIWGPTHVELGYRPWGNDIFVVENQELNCRPCHPHGPKKCPLGHHQCMKGLHFDKVTQLLELIHYEKLLKKTER